MIRSMRPDVLVYGELEATYLVKWAESRKLRVAILPTRFTWSSSPILVLTAIKVLLGQIKRKDAFLDFALRFIRLTSPKVVATFLDNDIRFWELRNKFLGERPKFVAIQNGRRGGIWDLDFGRLTPDEHGVDAFFCFGSAIEEYYRVRTSTDDYILLGSSRNNRVSVTTEHIRAGFAWISSYRNSLPPGMDERGRANFFLAEKEAAMSLQRFALERNELFFVIGCQEASSVEREWFCSFLGENQVDFIPKTDGESSYELLDRFKLVGTVHSTLGYEAIARGCRCFFFDWKAKILERNEYSFGYPDETPAKGLFWSRSTVFAEIEKSLDQLLLVDSDKLALAAEHFTRRYMNYDPENSSLWRYLDKAIEYEGMQVE